MTQSAKIRLAVWAAISAIIVIVITVLSYNSSKGAVDVDKVFNNKTEEQIKMEMVELNNYEFESKPLYTVKTNDYQFDIFRTVNVELTNNYGFYIVGTNLANYTASDGKEYVKTGVVDFMLYEATETEEMAKPVNNIRLKMIDGTNIMVGFLEFKPTNASDYSLVIDCSRCEEAFGMSEIDVRRISTMYDVLKINSAKTLREFGDLKEGYAGDLVAAGYAKSNIGSVIVTFIVSTIIVGGVAAMSFYTLEKEVFNKKGSKKA